MLIPVAATEIEEGRHIAQLAGCSHCHGDRLNGAVVDDIPHLVRLVAPNISVMLPTYSDAQLTALLRQGIKPDGHSALFMPSEMFRHLSDQELGRLIAWLRTVPVTTEGITEKTQLRVLGRFILASGNVEPSAAAIPTLPPAATAFDPGDAVSLGRHLTMSYCSECHGQRLEGFAPVNAPPLTVAKAYSLEQFVDLMHEGKALGDRDLRLMGPTSRVRFARFTAEEVAAVHAFLQSL